MNLRVVAVPYDSGHRAVRMGRGPIHLLDRGLVRALETAGASVEVVTVDSTLALDTEVACAFDLARSIARHVRAAREQDAFPLVLAGNCFSAVGTVTGLGTGRTGVLWFDAHGDLNTPDTTRSGFLDGMAAATLTGRCWNGMTGALPGFSPVPDERVVLVGARDLDPAETRSIRSGIGHVTADAVRNRGPREAAGPEIARIARDVDGFYLHVDLDVLDPDLARANAFPAPGGLTVEDVTATAGLVARLSTVRAAAITAYDPDCDAGGRAAAAALTIAAGIAAAIAHETPPPAR